MGNKRLLQKPGLFIYQFKSCRDQTVIKQSYSNSQELIREGEAESFVDSLEYGELCVDLLELVAKKFRKTTDSSVKNGCAKASEHVTRWLGSTSSMLSTRFTKSGSCSSDHTEYF